MRVETLLEYLKARPFRPFWIVLADGERIEVRHPEWVAAAGGRTAVVMEPNDRMHAIDIGLVIKLEADPPASAGHVRPETEEG